jgi:hypothetical protein
MTMGAPERSAPFRPPPSRLERVERELRTLDSTLADLLGEPQRYEASWFEGHLGRSGRPRPDHWGRR